MPRETMSALVCPAPGELALVERAAPGPAPAGWVEIEIARVGLCGTDFHIFEGTHPFLAYPRVMGHELSGRVVAAAEGFAAGEVVIVNPYLSCGTCHACRKGRENCCARIEVLGVHRDGGLCGRLQVPAGNLYPAEGLGLEAAAMVEFLAIGAHAVRRAGPGPGERALVVGAGPIGIGTGLLARRAGAEVAMLDTSPARRETVARRFGFAEVHDPGAGVAGVLEATGGEGFDHVFDATGNARAMAASLGYVAHGGTLVFVGVTDGEIAFPNAEFHKRETTLLATRNATRLDFETAAAALRSGEADAAALHTHSTALVDLPARFPDWAADRAGVVKAVVTVAP